MQEKKRYVLVRFRCETALSREDASKAVSQAVLEGIGALGAAKAKAYLKEYDEDDGSGVVKCQTEMLQEVRASLALKNSYLGKPLAIRTEKTSGAIGKVWKKKPA
jgi:RNase P/RNase MRP subunit POP5